jgi:hypothetical protein
LFSGHQAVVPSSYAAQTAAGDTTINAVQVKYNPKANAWKIEWLKPIENMRVRVTGLHGKNVVDQTFGHSANGEFTLLYLTPGFYTLSVRMNNEPPFYVHLQQQGFSRPEDDD